MIIDSYFFLFLEEILEQSRAFWFSKNGEKLLYATFDASNVHEVTLDKSFKQSEDCDFFERRRRRKREAQDDYPDYPEYPDYPDEGKVLSVLVTILDLLQSPSNSNLELK